MQEGQLLLVAVDTISKWNKKACSSVSFLVGPQASNTQSQLCIMSFVGESYNFLANKECDFCVETFQFFNINYNVIVVILC